LFLGGSQANFGALDTLLFGGATAPDVRLHREYNRRGCCDLQVSWLPRINPPPDWQRNRIAVQFD
jgi:hypothetical protein